MPADLKVSLAVNFLRINQKRLFTLPFLVCSGEGLRSKKMKRKSLEMPESSVETSSGRLWLESEAFSEDFEIYSSNLLL